MNTYTKNALKVVEIFMSFRMHNFEKCDCVSFACQAIIRKNQIYMHSID